MQREANQGNVTIVAMPIVGGALSAHFGHCEHFGLFKVDRGAGTVLGEEVIDSPEHQPGLLPKWLAEQGVDVVIAGGIGGRARQLLDQHGIGLVAGAPNEPTRKVLEAWLEGQLVDDEQSCNQHRGGCH